MKITKFILGIGLILALLLILNSAITSSIAPNSIISEGLAKSKAADIWSRAFPSENFKIGEGFLIYNFNNQPLSYLIAINNNSTIGVVEVNARTGEWNWFSQTNSTKFIKINKDQAKKTIKKVSKYKNEEPILVALGDKKLYWKFKIKNEELFIDSQSGSSYNQGQISKKIKDAQIESLAKPEDTIISSQSTPSISIIQETLPVSFNLNVPYYYQENDYFCAEAALQMVFAYWGKTVSQTNIGKVANALSGSGTYGSDLNRAVFFSNASSAIQDPNLQGYPDWNKGDLSCYSYWDSSVSPVNYNNRYQDLKNFIAKGYPIILLTWYDSGHSNLHFRVLKGYNDTLNTFTIQDPSYSGTYQGSNVNFNQNFLVDNLWAGGYRWGMIVEPLPINISYAYFDLTSKVLEIKAAPHGYCSVAPSSRSWYLPSFNYVYNGNALMSISLPAEFSLLNESVLEKNTTISKVIGLESPVTWKIKVPDVSGNFSFLLNSETGISSSSHSESSFHDILGSTKTYSIFLQKTQVINVSAGWNILNFTVLPENKNLLNVLSSINGEYSQIKTQDAEGNILMWDETLPDFANDLTEINYNQIYMIDMKKNSTIIIVGN